LGAHRETLVSETGEDGELDVTKARQASSHPDWMRVNVVASATCNILPVLVTPAQFIRAAAICTREQNHSRGLPKKGAQNSLTALRFCWMGKSGEPELQSQ
jgi:hypothetical protein